MKTGGICLKSRMFPRRPWMAHESPISYNEAGAWQLLRAPPSRGRPGPLPCRPASPAGAGCAAGWPWAGAGARRRRPPPLLPLRSSACPRRRTWRACRCSGPRSGLSEMEPTLGHYAVGPHCQRQFTETSPQGLTRKLHAGQKLRWQMENHLPSPDGNSHSFLQSQRPACQLG